MMLSQSSQITLIMLSKPIRSLSLTDWIIKNKCTKVHQSSLIKKKLWIKLASVKAVQLLLSHTLANWWKIFYTPQVTSIVQWPFPSIKPNPGRPGKLPDNPHRTQPTLSIVQSIAPWPVAATQIMAIRLPVTIRAYILENWCKKLLRVFVRNCKGLSPMPRS